MSVRIVTDSTCDLSPETIKALDITVLPIYLLFGTESYRDGIDINTEEFYHKLMHGSVYPTTSQPTPQDFSVAFNQLAQAGADGIICIHISVKLSGALNSAKQAKQNSSLAIPIEIIDSQTVSLGIGLIVSAAARMAKAGKSMAEITEAVHRMIACSTLLIVFDTLEFLAKGGRIGKVSSLLGTLLNIKPVVTIKDGELIPSGKVRSHAKGKERLLQFVNNLTDAEDIAVAYNTTPDEAKEIADLITVGTPKNISIDRLGSVISAHGGPGVLGIAVLRKSQPKD